jgi:hypothetical protein
VLDRELKADEARRCLVLDAAAASLVTKDHEGTRITAVPQLQLGSAYHTYRATSTLVGQVETSLTCSYSQTCPILQVTTLFISISAPIDLHLLQSTSWTTTTTRQKNSSNSLIQIPSSLRYTRPQPTIHIPKSAQNPKKDANN